MGDDGEDDDGLGAALGEDLVDQVAAALHRDAELRVRLGRVRADLAEAERAGERSLDAEALAEVA